MPSSIYDLSWKGDSFWAKLQLFWKAQKEFWKKRNSRDSLERAAAYSALSSTYYSIAGTTKATLKAAVDDRWFWFPRLTWFMCSWFWLGGLCYYRMLDHSDKMIRILGYHRMSAAQCDIRQSILRRRGRLKEAHALIIAAIHKSMPAHTAGLLRVGLADIYIRQGDHERAAQENIRYAVHYAAQAVVEGEKNQAARIYRNCADLLQRLSPRDLNIERYREEARSLVKETGSRDQRPKLGFLE